jgi:hypothetical protein
MLTQPIPIVIPVHNWHWQENGLIVTWPLGTIFPLEILKFALSGMGLRANLG